MPFPPSSFARSSGALMSTSSRQHGLGIFLFCGAVPRLRGPRNGFLSARLVEMGVHLPLFPGWAIVPGAGAYGILQGE